MIVASDPFYAEQGSLMGYAMESNFWRFSPSNPGFRRFNPS
jgi:hypothetical protein